MQTLQNAIGGRLTTSASTRTQPVFNPATGEESATLRLSTLAEVDAAVAAAKAALPGWACLNSCCRFSSGMPGPESLTQKSTLSACSSASTMTEPSAVYLTAFCTRFPSASTKRSGSSSICKERLT